MACDLNGLAVGIFITAFASRESQPPQAVFGHGGGDGFVDLVDAAESFGVEDEVGGLEGFVELVDGGGAHDGGGDEIVLFAPGHRQRGHTQPEIPCDNFKPGGGLQSAPIDKARRHGLLPRATIS